MPDPSFRFEELTRGDGYRSSLSNEQGAAQCTYQLKGDTDDDPPSVAELSTFAAHLLGGVDNLNFALVTGSDPEAGKIWRRLPKLHPYFPQLSVAGIQNIVGAGTIHTGQSIDIDEVPAVTDQFQHYQRYDYAVQFSKRPYFLYPDSVIQRYTVAGYYWPGFTSGDVAADFTYAEEWKRFTVRSQTPLTDTVSATTVQPVKFRTSDADDPNDFQFPGQSYLSLENHMVEVMWYLVPFRYFLPYTVGDDTYYPWLTRFMNHVNQRAFLGYPAGSLLYLGATPQVFIPEVFDVETYLENAIDHPESMLCNVKLRFLNTQRVGSRLPSYPNAGLEDRNNIAGGHNLQPHWQDRRFYYATTENPRNATDETKWKALFKSIPFELLFTDPLLVQPTGKTNELQRGLIS